MTDVTDVPEIRDTAGLKKAESCLFTQVGQMQEGIRIYCRVQMAYCRLCTG